MPYYINAEGQASAITDDVGRGGTISGSGANSGCGSGGGRGTNSGSGSGGSGGAGDYSYFQISRFSLAPFFFCSISPIFLRTWQAMRKTGALVLMP